MGNSLRVSDPYIVDEYGSDEDDDYYSAYETGHSDTEHLDENTDGLKPPGGTGRQISVDAAVVSKLVSEVEDLMSHLNNQNYDAAYNAALNLKQGGVTGGLDNGSPKRQKSGIPVTRNSAPKHDKQANAENERNETIQAKRSTSDEQEANGGLDNELISDELLKTSDDLCAGIIPEIKMTAAPTHRSSSRTSSNSGGDNCDVFECKGGNNIHSSGAGSENGNGCMWESGNVNGDGSLCWEIDVGDFKENKSLKYKPSGISQTRRRTTSSETDKTDQCMSTPVISSPDHIGNRKVLDLKRWYCMSRPQYKKSCGASSIVSCWNYLFSTLGNGSLPPITQEQALSVLGFNPPFSEIKFGPFTGNITLLKWFRMLNDHYKVRGRCFFIYKPVGKNRTSGVTPDDALNLLKKGLQDTNSAFVYHCQNHYFCPIGYEDMPLRCEDAYKGSLPQDFVETWILIGDTSRYHPAIHCKKWSDISADLNNENPEYIDIRRLWKGTQTRKKTHGNLHCIMAFQKVNIHPRRSQIPRSQLPVRRTASGSDKSPCRVSSPREPSISNPTEEDEPLYEEEDFDVEDEIATDAE